MTDQTLMYLQGFTTVQDQATYLTESTSASATLIKVNDTSAMSRGIVEIDDELLFVDQIDSVSQNMQVPPYGRGFRSTVAATHDAGTRVVSSPMFPRFLVKKALNEAILAVHPELFGVGETIFNFNPAVSTYPLPAGALDILQVSWASIGPSREWLPVRRYRVDKHAATGSFSTGATVSLYDAIVPGRQVKIVYTKQPDAMVNDSDVFTTVTGLPSSCEDVIRLGAAYRMTPFFDTAHLSGMSAEADFSANMRPTGNSAQVARFLLQMYQVRFAEETKGLQSIFPNRSYYTR
jgi:hypothetical protein